MKRIALVLLLCVAAGTAVAGSNKWRLQVSGGAESDGTITMKFKTVAGDSDRCSGIGLQDDGLYPVRKELFRIFGERGGSTQTSNGFTTVPCTSVNR